MNKIIIFILIFLCIQRINSLEFISPSEIQPGMKGCGLTVFRGWEPERFDVEIIDIIKNAQPKGDIILAKVSGNILEESGIIAGMSGSPVYINGKLAGAIAFTWSNSKEPICGITPIGEMLKEKDNADAPSGNISMRDDGRFKEIATPLYINGFSGEAKKYLEDIFNNVKEVNGYMVLSGGETGSEIITDKADLKAGDAVSVNLIDGDYLAQGIGTVTYVSNEDVYIFGHPMDLAGNAALPISKSYIYTVVPSTYLSFKLGSSSKEIGSVLYDGQNAVYCKLGKDSGMIPIRLKVKNQGKDFDYNFRVADNRYYFPGLASSAISSSLQNHTGFLDDKRISMSINLNLVIQNKDFMVNNNFQYAFNPSYFNIYGMLSDLNQYFAAFFDRNYGKIEIKNIKIDINVENGIKYYSQEGFSIDKQSYSPGEIIHCKVLLREFGGNYKYQNLNIKIPDESKNGQYLIISGNEMAFNSEIVKLFPKYLSINSIEDLLTMANFHEDTSLFTVGMVSARPGIIDKDKRLESFPENYISFINRTSDKAYAYFSPDIIKETVKIDGVVFGSMKISVNIVNRISQAVE